MALIRKSEFAKIKGVSAAAVSQAISSGRIRAAVVTRNGKEFLDHDMAALLWERNTLQQPPPTKAEPAPTRAVSDRQLRDFIQALPEDEIPDLNKSRARHEHYKAEKARQEALQGRGELVPAQEVKAEAARLARQVRDLLLMIPARTAGKVATMQDQEQIRSYLMDEIETALRGLANA
jgi:hypothetical protein